jgi:hypothetical protein
MFEFIIMCVVGFAIGFLITNKLLAPKSSRKSDIIRIDDKNWIVNNKFVSFEEDTPVLRMQQEQEDRNHYFNYMSERIMYDTKRVSDEFFKTTKAIHQHPDLKDCITPEKLLSISDKYEKYLFMCKKLNANFFLTNEQFLIKEENPIYCGEFSMFFPKPMPGYIMYNPKTAKYANGDVYKLIEAEFKEKYY